LGDSKMSVSLYCGQIGANHGARPVLAPLAAE
jgi:hypothetical protein